MIMPAAPMVRARTAQVRGWLGPVAGMAGWFEGERPPVAETEGTLGTPVGGGDPFGVLDTGTLDGGTVVEVSGGEEVEVVGPGWQLSWVTM